MRSPGSGVVFRWRRSRRDNGLISRLAAPRDVAAASPDVFPLKDAT